MNNILDYSYNSMISSFEEKGIKKFRANQICDWIYSKNEFDFDNMTNLSKELRANLKDVYKIDIPELVERKISKRDLTQKYLFSLDDANSVESVLLFHGKRVTACISSQVGCAMGCKFCATGKSGFKRNLSVGEITGQILAMQKISGERVGNVVFMGMGEPLLNFENVKQSILILNDEKMFGIGIRRISVSTCGIVPAIERMADELPEVTLSVSLHAHNNMTRDLLMPVNGKYPIEELIQSIRTYQEITGNRVTFEYILIDGVNDSKKDAKSLAQLLKGLKSNINVIPVNPVEDSFKRPEKEQIKEFVELMNGLGIETVERIEKGTDIDGACGQLRNRNL